MCTPYEDVQFWHGGHFRTEPSPDRFDANHERLRKFVRELHQHHPLQFQRLYYSCFGSQC